jgi:1,4-dihydroxy-2-naphthoyl-CoA hydrolase
MSELATPQQIRDTMSLAVLLGVELLEAGPELVRGRLEWAPERCTAGGLLHGGALMALADSCGGVCAFLNLPEGSTGTATIESKTNFMRAVRDGAVLAGTRPLYKGRTMIVVESELTREDGALVAKVTQTQAFHYPRA